MATPGAEWERKISHIFDNVGFQKIDYTGNPGDLLPNTYWMEHLNPMMQIDVFVCLNKRQWLVIECRDRRNKTIKKWLHEIKGRTEHRRSQLKKELRSRDVEVYGIAATSLKDLDAKTQETANETGVALWHHGVVDYLMTLSKGAKSQVKDLVIQRCGVKSKKYEPIELPIQRWPLDREPWFIGFVSPLEIAHATFVYQRGQGFGENAYQRFLKPQRIGQIADFVKSGGTFPNSIVLALPKEAKLPKKQKGASLVTVSIPGRPESIKIIDGQHRFFGALASGENPKLLCTFVKMEELDQAIMFTKINAQQVSVSKAQVISLFGIPDFAAKLATGSNSQKEKERILIDETIYRTLQRMDQKGLFSNRLNFYPGRPSKGKIPFKFLFDTIKKIANKEQSGYSALPTDPKERGRVFADKLSDFLSGWSRIIGEKNLRDEKVWFQPTMLSALLLTYPAVKWSSGEKEAEQKLRKTKKLHWKPRPERYRGGQGSTKLARTLCSKVGVKPQFI